MRTNHEALRAVYAKLITEKVSGLLYLKADDLLGDDSEATIDGSHPTNLGLIRQAAAFAKLLKGS